MIVLAAMTLIAWGLLESVNQLAGFALEADNLDHKTHDA